jgi:dimethylhistidine N-methyltransferase
MTMSATAPLSEFAAAVRAGLTREGQKSLPCQYLYDAVGTALFNAICLLPEYGLTRADDRLLRTHAADVARAVPGVTRVVELGSGDGIKTRHVLEALRCGKPLRYYPVDVSATALEACRALLGGVADVRPVHASYLDGLTTAVARRSRAPLLVLFLGGTIGNFNRAEALGFLRAVRRRLRPGDALLVGADLVKPEAQLLAAYDDPAGVTAAFNLNLLARINRELSADFGLDRFAHEARYDRRHKRIEMHLRSRSEQQVHIAALGLTIKFRRRETIWTESSHKFEVSEILAMAAGAGFRPAAQWIDEEWPFSETLLVAEPATEP